MTVPPPSLNCITKIGLFWLLYLPAPGRLCSPSVRMMVGWSVSKWMCRVFFSTFPAFHITFTHSHARSYTDGRGCHAKEPATHQKQFWAQCHAQGHFDMQLGGAGDSNRWPYDYWTTNWTYWTAAAPKATAATTTVGWSLDQLIVQLVMYFSGNNTWISTKKKRRQFEVAGVCEWELFDTDWNKNLNQADPSISWYWISPDWTKGELLRCAL